MNDNKDALINFQLKYKYERTTKMKPQTDKSATTRWNNSDVSYKNYQNYIMSKGEKRYHLTMIDLLYVSNFKGGNASIHEDEERVNHKLRAYSAKLIEINKIFGARDLSSLTGKECKELIDLLQVACNLTKEKETKIFGIGASYLSALLNAYFPNLIPILDRRVLINMRLVKNDDIAEWSKQIKKIETFYGALVEKSAQLLSEDKGRSLRDIDRVYFIRALDYKGLE